MLIKSDDLEALKAKRIDTMFRHWARPTVKAGGTLTTSMGVLSIDAVDVVATDTVSAEDLARAGYPDIETLKRAVDNRRPGKLYRIRLHYSGADPRIALREQKSLDNLSELDEALARLDRGGEWTEATLALIAKHPGLVAQTLADRIGIERDRFKARVRQLKGLGLTESLEVGYRISPRGKALLARRKGSAAG